MASAPLRCFRLAMAAAVAVGVLAGPAATARPTHSRQVGKTSLPQLSHRGPFLTDAAGRVVFIHGVNAVYKRAPYVAPKSARGFTARDADFLARNGLNGVRLGVLFAGVMPKPGVIDHHYLNQVNRIVQLLASRHIWVLLDFHQDAFNERFDGEGFPAWATNDDGLPFVNLGSFFVNDQTPAVQHAYDHLWNDDTGLWHYYAQAWKAVAKKWRDQPYLMGYDLFNEPNAGSQMLTCANPLGCPIFDARLEKFYDYVRAAIRTVDHRGLVFYEPQFLFNAISQSNFTHVDDPEVALSWHDYACTPAFVEGGVVPGDLDCQINEPRVMDNAAAQIKAMGGGGIMSEFGAGDDLSDLARLTSLADGHLSGWMYWQYKHWADPTGGGNEGLFADDSKLSSVKTAKLAVLVHPYPQAIAGTPTSMSWNATAKTLRFGYVPNRSTGLTDVFLPALTCHHGCTIKVKGGKVVRRTKLHAYLRSRPGAKAVAVTVAAKRS
ncbi:MAG TPA: cellulase family glycosylhydrolase [Mycobacteriales bacterium]|nr:cellulase family glycosylhydrolase [Mycobacteriales bacterium]